MKIIQIVDLGEECKHNYYYDQKFHEGLPPKTTSVVSWRYHPAFKNHETTYCYILNEGCEIHNQSAPKNKKNFIESEKKIKAFINSCKEVGLDLNKICISEYIPKKDLMNYLSCKEKCLVDIINTQNDVLVNHAHMKKIHEITEDIKSKKIILNKQSLALHANNKKYKNHINNLISSNHISYDMFKTKTGRLATEKNTFPILTMPKELRNCIVPQNDWLFEMDFNAMELRVLLGLCDMEQPQNDLHAWNKELMGTRKSRENVKKAVFAWLYDSEKEAAYDKLLEQHYKKEEVKQKFWDGTKVKTIFKREIESDEHHSINYIIQSTASDLFFEQVYKIFKMLRGKKSFIKFCNHDSVIIDLAKDDQLLVAALKDKFAKTRFGSFKINCFGGKMWGDMKVLNIH